MQNFKIFLTAFVTGLIVFGILAVLLIHFGFRTMSGEHEFDFGTGDGTDISDTYAENGENQLSSDGTDIGLSSDGNGSGTADNPETDGTQTAD